MAYSELIKNFERIRDYMREFYVYGFKSRDEFTKKSARSYDDERRRVESWLGDYMRFRQTADGKKGLSLHRQPHFSSQSVLQGMESEKLYRWGYHASFSDLRCFIRSGYRAAAQRHHG